MEKYSELIKSGYELRNAFLNEVVKFHIEEFLKVDIFVGFPSELVMMCDSFELAMQQVLYRSIGLKKDEMYKAILQFMEALSEFSSYMSTIGEFVNEHMIRVMNIQIRNEHESYLMMINMLRDEVIKKLNKIE